jgi:hypothetical protein
MKFSVFAIFNLIAVTAFSQEGPSKPRAARSVHLGFPGPEAGLFYNEMIIDQSTKGSYFMAAGWNTGYFGLQQLGNETNKVVLFSVWDSTRGDDPSAVKAEERVEVLYSDPGVRIKRFGGEGTGGQCMAPFNWKIGATNRFLVQGIAEGKKTAYTAWIFRNDLGSWWKLATFRTFHNGALAGYYSFVEDFRRDTASAGVTRRARFGNTWITPVTGGWTNLVNARFTASNATWESKENIDAGMAGNWFYLATGGDVKMTTPLKSILKLPEPARQPTDLPAEAEMSKP